MRRAIGHLLSSGLPRTVSQRFPVAHALTGRPATLLSRPFLPDDHHAHRHRGGFDPTASPSYLLPALAAVFLGTAVVMPGQFNPLGTLIGIYFLETGIIGLQLLGYSGRVQDAFHGAGLVAAVTVAHLVRNRTRVA